MAQFVIDWKAEILFHAKRGPTKVAFDMLADSFELKTLEQIGHDLEEFGLEVTEINTDSGHCTVETFKEFDDTLP